MKKNARMLNQLRANFCGEIECAINIHKEVELKDSWVVNTVANDFGRLENTVNNLLYFGIIDSEQAEDLLCYCDSYMQGIMYDAGLL